jgi:YggT family protein
VPIVVTILLTIIWAALLAYIFILMMRIVLGWFAPESLGRAWDLLTASTDPYLKLFARIRFLRSNLFDFSPIAAILALVVVLDLVSRLRDYMSVTLGTFLASVTSAAWSGVQFLLLFFLLVGILRTIPLVFRSTGGAGLWKVVDMLMQPVVAWVTKTFRLGLRSGYTQHLLLTLGLLLVAWILGGKIVNEIIHLFEMIPF